MSLEKQQLEAHVEEIRQQLHAARQKTERLEKEWIEANRKNRDWVPGKPCQSRSFVDGWLCCLDNDHEHEHETAGGYKFVRTR